MLKRFEVYRDALDHARAFGNKHSVYVYVVDVWVNDAKKHVHFVVSASSYHLLDTRGRSTYHPVSGWYFGGCAVIEPEKVAKALAQADVEPLPGKLESNYELVAGHTSGWTHEQRLAVAQGMETNGRCLWHECARYFGSLDTCPCCPCVKARKEKKR